MTEFQNSIQDESLLLGTGIKKVLRTLLVYLLGIASLKLTFLHKISSKIS